MFVEKGSWGRERKGIGGGYVSECECDWIGGYECGCGYEYEMEEINK